MSEKISGEVVVEEAAKSDVIPTEENKKGDKTKKKSEEILTKEQLVELVANSEANNKNFGLFIEILDKTKKNNKLSEEDIVVILDSVKEKFAQNWYMFALRICIDVYKKDDRFFATVKQYIVKSVISFFESFEITNEVINNQCKDFANSENLLLAAKELIAFFDNLYKKSVVKDEQNGDVLISCIYIVILSKIWEFRSWNYIKLMSAFERAIVEHFSDLNDTKLKKLICSSLPKRIVKGNFKKKANELTYLYFGQTELITEYTEKIKAEQYRCDSLVKELNKRNQYIDRLNEELDACKSRVLELEECLLEEKKQREIAEGRLDFEKNKYGLQVESLSSDFAEKVADTIEIELQGMEDITARLGEKEKSRIERFIGRIRKKLKELGEGENA